MSLEQIARDIREGTFPCKSDATLREEASPREYTKFKYSAPAGTCKCGKCHLVPPEKLNAWAMEIDALRQALQFYAEPRNYSDDYWKGIWSTARDTLSHFPHVRTPE